MLLANRTSICQEVRVESLANLVQVRCLDATNAVEAISSPERYRAQEGDHLQTCDGVLQLCVLPCAVAHMDAV